MCHLMKKKCLIFIFILILMDFSSCQYNSIFIQELNSIANDSIFADNEPNMNIASSVCSYGNYMISICHNKTKNSDDIVVLEKSTNLLIAKYKINKNIINLKPVDNTTVCFVCLDNNQAYYTLNLKTGKISEITPQLRTEYEILRIEPFFQNNNIFIVATTGIIGQGEPFFSIFKQKNNEFVNIVSYCTQFQFANDALYIDNNSNEILKIDANEDITTYKNFSLDLITSLITQNKVISNIGGVFKITDIETDNLEWIAISQFPNLPGDMIFYYNSLIFVDSDGIKQWDFNTYKIKKLCEYSPDTCSIFDDNIYFELDNSIFKLNLSTNELIEIC